MKKILIALITMAVMVSCSTSDQYLVKGTLEGSGDEIIFLQKREGGKWVKVDSVQLVNGTFQFAQGSVDYPEMYYLAIEGKRGAMAFFLENSDIMMTGHADSIYNVQVEGSSSHDEYKAYNDQLTPFYEKNSELYQAYRAASQAGEEEKAKSLSEERDALFEEIDEFNATYIKENPSSFVSPVILNQISYGMEAGEIEEVLNGFDKKLSVSQTVIDLRQRVEALRKVEIGKIAPDFTMNDVEGNPVTLSELKGHKLLLIDFWAAWCGPCRRENPNVVAVYREFNEKGFDVLGVSLDNNKEDWLEAIAADTLTWTHVSDLAYWDNAAAKLYSVRGIPASFLVDAEGKILAKNLRGEDLGAKVAELLAE